MRKGMIVLLLTPLFTALIFGPMIALEGWGTVLETVRGGDLVFLAVAGVFVSACLAKIAADRIVKARRRRGG